MSRCLLEDTMIYKAKGLFEFLVIDTTLHQYMIDHLNFCDTSAVGAGHKCEIEISYDDVDTSESMKDHTVCIFGSNIITMVFHIFTGILQGSKKVLSGNNSHLPHVQGIRQAIC